MNLFWEILSAFLVVLLWGMANGAFDEGKNIRGWINIALSAGNAAALARMFFS